MTIDTKTLRSASKRNDVYKSAMQGLLAWAADHIDAQVAEIARLRTALAGLIAVCEPNIYPQPDKPNSAWAKLVAARAALQEKSNG